MPISIFQFIVLPYLRTTSSHTLRTLATFRVCCKPETSVRVRTTTENKEEDFGGRIVRSGEGESRNKLESFRLEREKIPPDKGKDTDSGGRSRGGSDSRGSWASRSAVTMPTTFRGKLESGYPTPNTSRPGHKAIPSTLAQSHRALPTTTSPRGIPSQHIDSIRTYDHLDADDRTALEALQLIIQVHQTVSTSSQHIPDLDTHTLGRTNIDPSPEWTNPQDIRPQISSTVTPVPTFTNAAVQSTTATIPTRPPLPPSLIILLANRSFRLATFHALRTPQYASSPALLHRLARAIDRGGAGKLAYRLKRGVERFEAGHEEFVRLWTGRTDYGPRGDVDDQMGYDEWKKEKEMMGIGRKQNQYWGAPSDLDGMAEIDDLEPLHHDQSQVEKEYENENENEQENEDENENDESGNNGNVKHQVKNNQIDQDRINAWCDSNLKLLLHLLQSPPDPISQLHLQDLGLDIATITSPATPEKTLNDLSTNTLPTLFLQIHYYTKTHHFQPTPKTASLLLSALLEQVSDPRNSDPRRKTQDDSAGKKEIWGIWNVIRRVWERKLEDLGSHTPGCNSTDGLRRDADKAGEREKVWNEMRGSLRIIKSRMSRVGHRRGLIDVREWEKRFDLGENAMRRGGDVLGREGEASWWDFDIGDIEGRRKG